MLAATPQDSLPELHDHILVPDGRVGDVIGFYRRSNDESVLVLFPSSGDSDVFLASEVEILSARRPASATR
jgi:hypothetical protein